MPSKKVAKKSTRKQSSPSSRRNGTPRFGTYMAPRGNVTISVPPFWGFRQTNDDLQFVSPSGDVSVIVNAYSRTNGIKSLDARIYLDHLIAGAPKQSRVQREPATAKKAGARYRDSDGNSWFVEFVTDGKVLVLAELSSSGPLTGPEAKMGLAVLRSLKFKSAR